MRRSFSRAGLAVVGVAASAFFLWLAARDVDIDLVWKALRESEYLWLVPAVALLAVAVAIRALRWRLLFDPGTRPPFGAVTRAMLVGLLFNSVLPARAGEAARIVVLHQEARTSRVESLGTTVTERLYDVVTLLVLLFAATPFLPEVSWLRRAAVLALALTALIAAAVLAVDRYGVRAVRFVLSPLTRLSRVTDAHVERAASNLVLGLAALHRPRLALPAFALTILSWIVIAGSFWCVLEGFDLGLGLEAGLLVTVTTTLALVIPSAPGGIGVFEAGGVVGLRAFGVDESEAFSATVVLHALNTIPYVIAGSIVLHRHAYRLRAQRVGANPNAT